MDQPPTLAASSPDFPLDTLIVNALLVAGGPECRVIRDGALGIQGDRVAWTGGPGHQPPPARVVVDAQGAVVLPGLVNAHCHLPMSLFRGLADDLALDAWLNEHIFPAEARFLSPETVTAGALLSLAELLLSGCTTVCDGYFFEDQVAEAAVLAGIRAVAAQGVLDFPAPGVPDPRENVRAAADFVTRWSGRSPLVTPAIFCHSPYTCGPDTLKAAKRAAGDAGALFQIHAAETRGEVEQSRKILGKTPIAHLHSLGVLDAQTLVVHAVWADERDVEILARSGAGVAVCTASNMKLASGIAPLPGLLAAGVPTGLGTDGPASNNRLDVFSEMGATARLHKLATGDPTAVGAKTALFLATEGGATALGLTGLGRLEPGWAADVVVLRPDRPNLTPAYDPVSLAVYAASGADVRHVWVAGRQVVEEG
ncbi:MAG: amidohydrolase, partial [Pseudomonadota bacterium]